MPWWAWLGIGLCIGAIVAVAVLQLFTITSLEDRVNELSHSQRSTEFQLCNAEKEIRAKFTEIELYLHKYVYVYWPPGC